MRLIQIPLEHWVEADDELLKVGRTSLCTIEPIYRVSDKQIQHLEERKIPFIEISTQVLSKVRQVEWALSLEERMKKGEELTRKAIAHYKERKEKRSSDESA